MRQPMLLLAVLLPGCAGLAERYPFRNVAPEPPPPEPPAGVLFAVQLDGVVESSRDGVPRHHYEFVVEVESEDSDAAPWEAILDSAALRDDEGRTFPVSALFVDTEAKRARRYRAEFSVEPTYRFRSIAHARVTWRLRRAGGEAVPMVSAFQQ